MLMFGMTAEVAEEFFKRCHDRKADTRKARLEIMGELAKEGKLTSITQTDRTPDQVAEDMTKNFGKVLYIKGKKPKKKGASK